MLFRIACIPLIKLLIVYSLASLVACSASSDPVAVSKAWIAEAPPTARVMVGYMVISNNTDQEIRFTAASSESFSSIEFHETVYSGGLARMVRHESLDIPAREQTVLQQGGKHLMLFNPVRAFTAGDMITISLTRENGDVISHEIAVMKAEF